MLMSDAELLEVFARTRSNAAFDEIVRRYEKMVYAICYHRLGDAHLAEDAKQNVFVVLSKNASRLEPGPVDGYLVKTSHLVCNGLLRKRASSKAVEREWGKDHESSNSRPGLSKQQVDAIQHALAELPRKCRIVVELHFYEQLPVRKIVERLGIPRETAKKRLRRGLQQMRNRLRLDDYTYSLTVLAYLLRCHRDQLALSDGGITAPTAHVAPVLPAGSGKFLSWSLNTRVIFALAIVTLAIMVSSAAVWFQRRQNRAQSQVAPTPAIEPQPQLAAAHLRSSDLTFEQRLHRRLPYAEGRGVSLEKMLDYLSRRSGIPIETDWESLTAVGVHRDLLVNLAFRDKTIMEETRSLLDSVAPPGKLQIAVRDRRIVISARADEPSPSSTTAQALSGG